MSRETDGSTDLFEVFYDTETEGYYIFAPKGCVLVGETVADIVDVDSDGNVRLPDELPEKLYAHVKKSGDDAYNVTFDGQSSSTGADYNFAVHDFVGDCTFCSSVVALGSDDGGGGGGATIDEDVARMKVASLQRKTYSGSGTEYIEVANFHNADSGTVPIAVYAKNERNESVKTISWEKLYVEWNVESISSPDGSFITAIQYDVRNHQIQVKRRSFKTETVQIMSDPQKTIEILTQVGEESEFETITGGQCVEQIHIEPET